MISQKIRIYPTPEQEAFLKSQCDYSRYQYNKMLELRNAWHAEDALKPLSEQHHTSAYDMRNYQKAHKAPWETETYHFPDIIEAAAHDVERAFDNFFDHRAKYPRFHSRFHSKQSFRIFAHEPKKRCLAIKGNRFWIRRSMGIRMAETPRFEKPSIATIEFENGDWYAAFTFLDEHPLYPKTGKCCGIDVGLKTSLAVHGSDGNTESLDLDKDELDRLESRRKHYERIVGHSIAEAKKNGTFKTEERSKRFLRAQKKLERIYRRASNVKKDFTNKAANQIAKEYDLIGLEKLNVNGMKKNRKLSHSLMRSPLGCFGTAVEAKAKLSGKEVQRVGRFFPSSQICNICGAKSPITKDLGVRDWVCPHCGAHLNRDDNAAVNIMAEAIRLSQTKQKG